MYRFLSALVLFVLLSPNYSTAMTNYYVSSAGINGDGSTSNPWVGSPNWATVQSTLASDSVTIYFDARGQWSTQFEVGASTYVDGGTNWLILDGMSKYKNGPTFEDETEGHKATWSNKYNYCSRNIQSGTNVDTSYVKIRGFKFTHGSLATKYSKKAGPKTETTSNFHHIVIEHCEIFNSEHGGVYLVFLEDGCHDITIAHNLIYSTGTEGIYVGHYNYLTDSITNVIVEHNTLINCGDGTEGDIDIKPPCYGAIVRYNTHYDTRELGGGACGVVVSADATKIYGNKFYSIDDKFVLKDGKPSEEWGHGIFVNSDGDASRGKAISSCLIYNNLLYLNDGVGIRVSAANGESLLGLKIFNNTIANNADGGLFISESNSGQIEIEMKNNILTNETGFVFAESGAVTLTSDNNLWYKATGPLARFNGVEYSWGEWVSTAGFDKAGANQDPMLIDYMPTQASPLFIRQGGADLSSVFKVDITGEVRTGPWSIGAYQSSANAAAAPSPPKSLRIK